MSIFDDVLAFINSPRPEAFEPTALAVFRYQFDRVPVYRRFCMARGVAPESVTLVSQIPAASTVAFKYADLCAPGESSSQNALTFWTSGTTKGIAERGRHLVPHPEIYRSSAIAHLRRMLFPDGLRLPMLTLHPTADRMPESSLSTMLTWCVGEFGVGATLCAASRISVDISAAIEFLDAASARREPVCILGTTAASTALFTALNERGRKIKLEPGSRLMDTGGAKGQAVPLTPAEVVAHAHETLGIEPAFVVNEYGMTEMCSQLYDATPFNSSGSLAAVKFDEFRRAGRSNTGTAEPLAPLRLKLPPPWLRPSIIDPVTLAPLDDCCVGLLTFFDLANVGSISALMTEDFGFMVADGVVILGRVAAGGDRGCALGIAEFARRGYAPKRDFESAPHAGGAWRIPAG